MADRNHSPMPTIERRELELLAEKVASLAFELLGFYEDSTGTIRRQASGSGIFVAPCQALTAGHVLNDLHRVNPGWADELRSRKSSQYVWLPYHVQALQIFDVHRPNR